MQQDLPLSGVRVIDFTQVMMGPVCTQTLGDYGADVIKIERKGAGDLSRSTFEPVAGADNPIFCSLNRNKRSVALDLRDPAHMAQVKALIAGADVVVNNFRAGVMERMGLGYDDCKALNPRVIYAVGTGYGETGPYAFKGGQDVLAQAISGVMARRSDASVPVSVYPTALADYSAGMHMVQGILLALLHRARTGQGQKISVSLYNSMLAMQMQEAAMILMADSGGQLGGHAPVRRVRHPHRAAGDGGRLQAQSAARHLRGAGNRRPVRRSALLRPDAAVQEQGSAAGHLPRALRRQYPRTLAGAGGGRHPVLAGAGSARSAGRPADAAQPDADRGRRRGPARALHQQPDHDVQRAGQPAPRAAQARAAQRGRAARAGASCGYPKEAP